MIKRVRVDGELIDIEATDIFDAFRKARAMRPGAVVVSDTTGGPDELHPADCQYCAAGEPSEHTYEPPTDTVEIPADVRDNSETVTDYAFMRHLSPDRGVVGPEGRDYELKVAHEYLSHMYMIYSWSDVNPKTGQRCRFDMVARKEDGSVVHLFHTEYWTRVKCDRCEYSYAVAYVRWDDEHTTTDPVPLCDTDLDNARRVSTYDREHGFPNLTLRLSERLFIGQHD
jgi:hypothetical protein